MLRTKQASIRKTKVDSDYSETKEDRKKLYTFQKTKYKTIQLLSENFFAKVDNNRENWKNKKSRFSVFSKYLENGLEFFKLVWTIQLGLENYKTLPI